ncbi:MAG: hypothetical protein JWO74_2046 [Solirubrobacterales bacterium]|jgi:hypothetical protein|nr:hypothetical protein [Solirubrobacterales bacterium]
MSNYLDALRQELVAASDRLTQPSPAMARQRRWWRRSPRALAIALAGLAVSATAIAATTPWQPLFGDPGSPQPRVTGSAPPAGQLALLSVLRRPQTPEDRGVITQQTLRYFGTSTQGVYTSYIRQLPSGQGALPAILLPARSWQVPGLNKNDVLCLFVAEANADGGAKGCYTTTEVESGTAGGSLGAIVYGLVPDGVAQVQFDYPTGTQVVAVHDNFYEQRAPQNTVRGGGTTPVRPQGTSWLDAQGEPTTHQPGSP